VNKGFLLIALALLVGLLGMAGCTEKAAPESKDGKIQAAMAKLDPEDRKLAEAQEWCAVEEENKLGGMGKPVKVTVKGQSVFVCCSMCKDRATADPDKTLAKVEELKAKHSKSATK
jgi:hypothetical protein